MNNPRMAEQPVDCTAILGLFVLKWNKNVFLFFAN